MSPDNTGKKQVRTGGGHFRKGASGNPGGRPAGARNKALLAMEALLDGEAEAITRVAVDKAKEGDTTALRLCLERILPPRKDRPVSFSLPQRGTVADAPAATAAIVEKYGTVLSQAPFHSLIGDASERRTAVPCIN